MRKTDHILSYLFPVTIEQTNSQWNPVLEILLYGGKYSLNSKNTNYSFGSLHSLFIRIFKRLNLNWNEINNVLILGFGTGSVATIIGKYKKDCIIDGVEIDSKIIELGEKYFNTNSLKNVTIHCASADQFVKNCHKKFDLIIIDVYLDLNVPTELETDPFMDDVKNAMNIGGMVIFNKFINSKTSRDKFPSLTELYKKTFGNLKMITVMGTDKIIIAKKLF